MMNEIAAKPDKQNCDALCPFFERECPLGEESSRLCWHRFKLGDDALDDYDNYHVDCLIADWMFSNGQEPFAGD